MAVRRGVHFDIYAMQRPLINTLESLYMINFTRIDHHSILVADITDTIHFYHQILGLKIDDKRPEKLPFKGAWFIVGKQAIHALELANPDSGADRPKHGGRDRHVALICDSIDALIEQLKTNKISFTRSKSGRAAIFFRDPDANAIEVIETE